MKLLSIAGARPNFMKLASIADAVTNYNADKPVYYVDTIDHVIIHTGQHYDEKMSKTFFEDLGIPKPDFNLEVGSATHAQQTAEIMKRFEGVLLRELPDVLLVVGDVNSTIACAMVAAKIQYPKQHPLRRPLIVHVEAGLRSFDRDMPEEINRILTDALSDLLFVTEESGVKNLMQEGCHPEKVHFVGNVMIDTLKHHLHQAKETDAASKLGILSPFGLITLHRPSNVDHPEILRKLVECFITIAKDLPLVFPIHPRTKNTLEQFNLLSMLEDEANIKLLPPLRYLEFLSLVDQATLLLTDSGGIQEETTYLGIPCITLRENTERPVTVTEGTNYLIGTDTQKILETVLLIQQGKGKKAKIPQYWDGKAGERIIRTLVEAVDKALHPCEE
jgi:UDP-N-acetylglucosamine 2-epimerase (non-hydrolysing)